MDNLKIFSYFRYFFGKKPKKCCFFIDGRKINKKEKQLALRTILFNRQNQFIVFNNLDLENAKTNIFLKNLVIDNSKKTLVISSKPNLNLKLSIRNLKNFNYTLIENLSNYNKKDNPRWSGNHNDYLFQIQ